MTWACILFGHEPMLIRRTVHVVCQRCHAGSRWVD
jgi:hypothetical protein